MTLSEKVCSERKSWFVVIELTRNRLVMPASPMRPNISSGRSVHPTDRMGCISSRQTESVPASPAVREIPSGPVARSKILCTRGPACMRSIEETRQGGRRTGKLDLFRLTGLGWVEARVKARVEA